MNNLEKQLFGNLKKNINSDNDFENDLIDELISQNWCELMANNLIRQLLSSLDVSSLSTDFSQLSTKSRLTERQIIRCIFYAGIACLELYVCDNCIAFIDGQQLADCVHYVKGLCDSNVDYDMKSDGELLYDLARSVPLLRFSRFAFTAIESHLSEDIELVYSLWRLRSAIVLQMSLTALSDTIYNEIVNYSKITYLEINDKNSKLDIQSKIQLLNETIASFLHFGDIDRVRHDIKLGLELSGLSINFSGELGVRTQYQQKPVSQLVLKVDRRPANGDNDCISIESAVERNNSGNDLPKNIALNDDTLLPNISFLSLNESESINLSAEEESLIMLIVKFSLRTGSMSDELLREQLLTYLDYLIKKSSVWSVQYQSLLVRSLLEKNSSRRVERSMMQIEELVESVRNPKCDFGNTRRRCLLFYCNPLNPYWTTEKYLAEILVSLGVYKTALEIFLRLHLWDDIIACYHRLGRRDKAENIIRERLKIEESPYLYCLLGDATDDIENYRKAWTLSKQTYPRAQKSLGNHYFNLKEFVECIPYYRRSVELNSMQTDVWFRLGFAAMIVDDYELSASAYRRVVQFETNSFEAWNNLSKAYIKLNQKFRAWKTLQEALKCNYDEWRIWENYIAVCVDVGAFAEAIQCWHRLIDLKGKYEDDQIADILVNAICNDTLDNNGESAAKLAAKAQQLFGRISATSGGSSKYWRLYAKLLLNNKVNDVEKITRCLASCHRLAVQSDQWFKTSSSIIEVLKHCMLLADEYSECALLDDSKALATLYSCKSALNSVVVTVNKNKFIWSDGANTEEIENLGNLCDEKIKDILNKILLYSSS